MGKEIINLDPLHPISSRYFYHLHSVAAVNAYGKRV